MPLLIEELPFTTTPLTQMISSATERYIQVMTATKKTAASTETNELDGVVLPAQPNGEAPKDVEETEETKTSLASRVREFTSANRKLVLTVAGATAAFVAYKVVQAKRAALTDEELEQETDGSNETA